jgi:hypothetical protein
VTTALMMPKIPPLWVTAAVLADGLTGPGTTALVNGLPGIGAPPTRTSTRSLPDARGV